MEDCDEGGSTDTVHGLAQQLVQADPPGNGTLTSIYHDKLDHPLSQGLEELLLRLEV